MGWSRCVGVVERSRGLDGPADDVVEHGQVGVFGMWREVPEHRVTVRWRGDSEVGKPSKTRGPGSEVWKVAEGGR